ncbi:DUF6164 family protein [Halomonas denitrificans]|nr:hypothetical protein [Halomonas denitrificans]
MARRLMNLRHVPAEEADGVRTMLDQLGVDWYELPPTAFGLSAGSIWIRDNEEYPRARDAFDRFQDEYTARARADAGNARRPIDPMRLLAAVIVAVVVLGFFFWPIVELMGG